MLAQERQDATKNKHKPQVDNKAKVVESLKKAGVENFMIRSAVPGTEVPEHKDWIVSKFGRVLPILHLRQKDRKKIIKYDPSKYCHNIKKLDHMSDLEIKTPVTNLTWHLEEQDDEMSKKRRGDFPTPTQPVKKKKLAINKYNTEDSSASDSNFQANKLSSNTVEHNAKSESIKDELISMTGNKFAFSKSAGSMNRDLGRQETTASNKRNIWSKAQVAYSDSDSEELELIIESEKNKIEELSQTNVNAQDMPLEVVGEDYILKHQTHWALNYSKEMLKGISINHKSNGSGSEYDSADTDEIISAKMIPCKNSPKTKSNGKSDSVNSKTEGNPEKEESESNSNSSNEESVEESSESNLDSDYEEMMSGCYRIDLSLIDLKQLVNSSSKSKKQNGESEEESEVHFPKCNSLQPPAVNLLPSNSGTIISQNMPGLKKNTTADGMIPAIQNEDSSDHKMTPNKQLINPPPFKGTQSLSEVKEANRKEDKVISDQFFLKVKRKMDKESCSACATTSVDKKQKVNRVKNVISSDSDGDVKSNCKPPPFKGTKFLQINTSTTDVPRHRLICGISESKEEKLKSGTHKLCSSTVLNGDESSDYENSNEDVKAGKQKTVHLKQTNSQKIKPSPSLVTESGHVKEKRECKVQIDGSAAKHFLIKNEPNISLSAENVTCSLAARVTGSLDKHLLDNQKRLAALQQRQKEAEMQKKLIQGALSNLESQKPAKGKHIVFDFEEESESEQKISRLDIEVRSKAPFEDVGSSSEAENANLSAEEGAQNREKLHVAKDFKNRTIGKLFDGSEEEDESDDDDHNGRFKIKPQFEGEAGQKLLALQSRFGTDERFRMDERFLESEEENAEESVTVRSQNAEEEEFAAEKKRALNILKSIIQVGVETTKFSKDQAKSKNFKDVSVLHYDPTREDHIVYESKIEETKKESKAERRKRREEAEKLPEVSKEIYYDVNMDLKEMFSSSTKEKEVAWDKKDDTLVQSTETETSQHTFDYLSSKNAVKEESADFTFSFFEAATHDCSQKPEFYKIESMNVTTFPWQEDPRFQDSSSEDEDKEKDLEDRGDTIAKNVVTFPEKKVNLFFFFKDDQRLKDGPKLFCRTTDLEDEKDNWEEKRTFLIEEYRKKHKDARRKIKAKQ
ncbi:nucleolar protein 8 isoform X2 [Heptranchias perlo]|uniref:nucleolar protein 8 isoform X2 n=1 Tax=Heptranchias perlo TaxID=212740 RepID=UPI0035596DFA